MECGISNCPTACAWISSFQPVLYQHACGTAVQGGCAQVCGISHALRALLLSQQITAFTTDQSALWLMFSAISTTWYLRYIWYTYMVLLQLGLWRPCQVVLLVLAVEVTTSIHKEISSKQSLHHHNAKSRGSFVDMIKTRRHCSCIREEVLAKMKWRSLQCQ